MSLFTLRLCMTQMEWLDSQWGSSLWHEAILFLKVLMCPFPFTCTPNGSSPTTARVLGLPALTTTTLTLLVHY